MSAGRFAVVLTVIAYLCFLVDQLRRLADTGVTPARVLEAAGYTLLVTVLTYSALAHLVARLGHLYRARAHQRVPRVTIDERFDDHQPTMTVLIPSLEEDARVVRQTLLTAALQEYPDLRVVLLIDDRDGGPGSDGHELLRAVRDLPGEIEALLEQPRRIFEQSLRDCEHALTDGQTPSSADLAALAARYRTAAAWFGDQAQVDDADHTDGFVRIEVLERMRDDLSATATAIDEVGREPGASVSARRVRQLHRRLVWVFTADVTSFERMQFASCSHAANKATNLNSYIELMGGDWSIESAPGGRVLVPASGDGFDLAVPEPDFVLTLDADSTLLPEYCLRLAYEMERPENERLAVIQTPYSAYRAAPTRLERMAGATTDIQHLVHQGLTHFGATFWVGANAVLRKRALDDLRTEYTERGFAHGRYIADRTVIEDTESSIDLRTRGWQLANYGERLSYSATPPDLGSLVVQRKRWANGGLVIMRKLGRFWRSPDGDAARPSLVEVALRANYLGSIATVSLGLLVILLYPFDQRLVSWFAVAAAVPYLVVMAGDLRRTGYRRRDVVGLYGFNLLLLPVNLVGAASSLVQVVSGEKVDFARTPKVRGRTVAPVLFIVMPLVLMIWSGYATAVNLAESRHVQAAFTGANALLIASAFVSFIGLRGALSDLFVGLRELIYAPAAVPETEESVPHWASVLYVGAGESEDLDRSASLAVALAAEDQPRPATRPDPVEAELQRVLSAGTSDREPSPVDAEVQP